MNETRLINIHSLVIAYSASYPVSHTLTSSQSPEHSPEVRIKKLNTFEKLTVLAETKLDTLKVTAKTLIEDDHYASEEIREIMNSLQSRYVISGFVTG